MSKTPIEDDTKQAPAPAPTVEPPPGITTDQMSAHLMSANEPYGSNIGGETTPPPVELPPLVLTSIDPASIISAAEVDFPLAVTGEGFDANCVVVFDDVDLPTVYVSPTELTATAPMYPAATIVDVEVHRGEDLSDVLTFEFTAVAGTRATKEPERRPRKAAKKGRR